MQNKNCFLVLDILYIINIIMSLQYAAIIIIGDGNYFTIILLE